MKLGTLNKFLVGASMVAMTLTLTACPGGGGGGSSAPAPAAAGALGVGGSGYVGIGNWSGQMIVQNLQLYQQFLYSSGLCYGMQCANPGPYFLLNVQTNDPSGMLPNLVYFSLRPYINYAASSGLATYGYGSYNGNGLIIQYNGNTGSSYYAYPGYPGYNATTTGPAGTTLLQINTQYTDGTHQGMNVQVLYMGQQFATGTITGYVQPGSGQYGGAAYGTYPGYTSYPGYTTYPGYPYAGTYMLNANRPH